MGLGRLGADLFDVLPSAITNERPAVISIKADDRLLLPFRLVPNPLTNTSRDFEVIGLVAAVKGLQCPLIVRLQAANTEVDRNYSSSSGSGATLRGLRPREAKRITSAWSAV